MAGVLLWPFQFTCRLPSNRLSFVTFVFPFFFSPKIKKNTHKASPNICDLVHDNVKTKLKVKHTRIMRPSHNAVKRSKTVAWG